MLNSKENNGRRIKAITLILVISTGILLSGCNNEPQTGTQTPQTETSTNTGSETNHGTEQPNQQQEGTNTTPQKETETEGLPSGVSVKRVIKDKTLDNNYHKKVELLTDGGKRMTITDSNGGIVLRNIEYEGMILKVDGRTVTVQVDQGQQQTLTIPDTVTIEDEDNLGLKQGVEIEWTIDEKGNIQSVELED